MLRFTLHFIINNDQQITAMNSINDFIAHVTETDPDHLFINYPYKEMDLAIGSYYMEIFNDEALVGFALFYPMAATLIYMRNFYILKTARIKNIFNDSMSFIIQQFSEKGVSKLLTFIDHDAKALVKRLSNYGFHVTAHHNKFEMLELDF